MVRFLGVTALQLLWVAQLLLEASLEVTLEPLLVVVQFWQVAVFLRFWVGLPLVRVSFL
jgi:hypothetical protein